MSKTTTKTTYTLAMRDELEDDENRIIQADSLADAREQAVSSTKEWIKSGEWGSNGARVRAWWTLADGDGDEVDEGYVSVDIEPDHDSLIAAAGGDTDCDHDWTSEGEGGCASNPGVWSHGGTAMSFATHCRTCGLHRIERHTGSQFHPGESDTVEYTQPATWCAECQREECRYPISKQYIRYTDCDDDLPNGEEISTYDYEDEALAAAKEFSHENCVRMPDTVFIAIDDTVDGDDGYHVFHVS